MHNYKIDVWLTYCETGFKTVIWFVLLDFHTKYLRVSIYPIIDWTKSEDVYVCSWVWEFFKKKQIVYKNTDETLRRRARLKLTYVSDDWKINGLSDRKWMYGYDWDLIRLLSAISTFYYWTSFIGNIFSCQVTLCCSKCFFVQVEWFLR